MHTISLVVFDLSGTTVSDDNAVAKCLFEAAQSFKVNATLEDFEKTIGTNKIHLYEFMLAKTNGHAVSFDQLEQSYFPEYHAEAMKIFAKYSVLMVDYYRKNTQPMPSAEATFAWCKANGIKIATDTGFHSDVNTAIMEGLGWLEKGMIDLSLNVENTGGIGRPAPYLIYTAMMQLGIQNIHEVIKIGDTPADLLSGYHAGCKGNIGVLSGANKREVLEKYPHTHIIQSVKDLPELISTSFLHEV